MAEKKNNKNKKNTASKNRKNTSNVKTAKKEFKRDINIKEEKEELNEVIVNNKKKKFHINKENLLIFLLILLACLLLALIIVTYKDAKVKNGDDVVISLKGKKITATDLYKSLKEKQGKDVAINLIDEYILDKEYKTTSDMRESAQATVDQYKKNYGEQYNSFLEYNGISGDKELKDLLIKNTKTTNVTEDYIKNNLTKKEMKDYYKDSIKGDIRAKHILISTETDENATDEEKEAKDNEAKEKAENIIKELKDGAKFDDLAKKYSDDKSNKDNGGDLGYFNTGDMVKEFETAAYALDKDQYTTEPVKTTYGYHIIYKVDQKEKPSYKKALSKIKKELVDIKKENDSTIGVKAMIALRKKYKLKINDKKIKSDYNEYTKTAVTTTTTTQASAQ